MCDLNGEVWGALYQHQLGDPAQGLFHFNGQTFTYYDSTNTSMQTNNVKSIAVDGANKIWIGTPSGLYCYDGANWTTFDSTNSTLEEYYPLAARGDSVWVGGMTNLSLFDGTNWSSWHIGNSNFPACGIHELEIASNGTIYLLGENTPEVYSFNTGTFNQIIIPGGDIIKCIALSLNDDVYMGSFEKIFSFNGTVVTEIPVPHCERRGGDWHDTFSNTPVRVWYNDIAFTPDGKMFASTGWTTCPYYVYTP